MPRSSLTQYSLQSHSPVLPGSRDRKWALLEHTGSVSELASLSTAPRVTQRCSDSQGLQSCFQTKCGLLKSQQNKFVGPAGVENSLPPSEHPIKYHFPSPSSAC